MSVLEAMASVDAVLLRELREKTFAF